MKPWERYQAPAAEEAGPWQSYAAPAPAPTPAPVEEEPGFFGRTMDRLQLGVSDAMSTLAGDTYGRSGDPTERDDLPLINPFGSNRLVKALGGDVLPAVGDVASDALITGGKAVLPQAAEDAVASGFQSAMESAPAQAIGQGIDAAQEFLGPDASAYAGELLNIGAALTPVKGVKPGIKQRGLDRAARIERGRRRREVGNLVEPDYKVGEVKYDINPMSKKKEWQRTDFDERMIDSVTDVKGVNPRKSFTENARALEKETNRIDARLKSKLWYAPDVEYSKVKAGLDDVSKELEGYYTIVGDAELSAMKIRKTVDKILNEATDQQNWKTGKVKTIRPDDLLRVRQRLDNQLRKEGLKIAGTDSAAAFDTSVSKIRKRINDLVNEAAPDAGVADDLSRQSDLLRARDIIEPRSGAEAKGNFQRWVEDVERSTGSRHPTTYQAQAETAKSKGALGIAGLSAAAHELPRRLADWTLKGDAAIAKVADALARGGVPAAQKAAILAAIQKEEENATK